MIITVVGDNIPTLTCLNKSISHKSTLQDMAI